MYPEDLDLLAASLDSASRSVLVQLSTYSANNDNAQQAVLHQVEETLTKTRLQLMGAVPADGQMMSIILGKGLRVLSTQITQLEDGFRSWLDRARTRE